MREPLRILLDFTRVEQPEDPYKFYFAPQDYVLRTEGGGAEIAKMPWSEAVVGDLLALAQPSCSPSVIQRVGEELRVFVEQTGGFHAHEAAIKEAVEEGRRVLITLRSAAAELYALPWELLTLKGTGQHIGELDQVFIRYSWPDTHTAREEPEPRPEGGRILFAWSSAGGAVPAAEHLQAIRAACALGDLPFDGERDVIPHVSYARLRDSLEPARDRQPVAVLHILCHGAVQGETFSLVWNDDDTAGSSVMIDAGDLRKLLAPHSGQLRMVVLAACDSGNSGALGNRLGSVSQALHRVGIQAVIASRFPLSIRGSVSMTRALYRQLLGEPSSIESAFLAARAELTRDPSTLDWASLQVYARDTDGDDTRPIVFRPYQGLLAFQRAQSRFFFGREDERRALLSRVSGAAAGRSPRLGVVAGASGSGKSSLVMAGVIPDLLEAEPARWEVIQLRPAAQGGARATILLLLQALGALAKPLPDAPESHALGGPPAPPADDRELTAWAAQAFQTEAQRISGSMSDRSALVVVDQFEEVFTLGWSAGEKNAFAAALSTLCSGAPLSAVVLLTLRVDFLGRCGEIVIGAGADRVRLDAIVYDPAHSLLLPQVATSALRAIVAEPATRVGLHFEAGLIDQILGEIGESAAALPLLQYALDQLWGRRRGHQLTQDAFHAMGSFMGALAHTADEVLGAMTSAELFQSRRLLVRMVNPAEGGGADTRRRARLDAVRPRAEQQAALFDRSLRRLVQSRLVVTGKDDGESGGEWAELAHEALIRSWSRLRSWVDEDRVMLRQMEVIRSACEEWKAHKGEPVVSNYAMSKGWLAFAVELEDRYGDELDLDIREYIEVSRRVEDAARTRERRRLQLLAGASLLVAMIFGVLVLFASRARALSAAAAEAEQRAAMRASSEAKRAADAARRSVAAGALSVDPTLAAVVLRDIEASESARGYFLQALIDVANQRRARTVLFGHESRISTISYSEGGRRLITSSLDGTARIFPADGEGEPLVLQHDAPVKLAAPSPDGKSILTVSADDKVNLWRTDKPGERVVLQQGSEVISAAWSADSARFLTCSKAGEALIWNASGQGLPIRLPVAAAIASVSPDGKRVATASAPSSLGESSVQIWPIDGKKQLLSWIKAEPVRALAWSLDGNRLALANSSGELEVNEVSDAGSTFNDRMLSPPLQIAWSPDGELIAYLGVNGRLDLANGRGGGARTYQDDVALSGIVWHGDSNHFLVFGANRARALTLDMNGLKESALVHAQPVSAAAFSPDGKHVATGAADGIVRIWDTEGAVASVVIKRNPRVRSVAWSPDGKRVLIVPKGMNSPMKSPRLVPADGTGAEAVLERADTLVDVAAFSPDGKHLLSYSDEDYDLSHRAEVVLWNLDGGDSMALPLNTRVLSAAWSPDGTRVATGSEDGAACVFRAGGGSAAPIVLWHKHPVVSVTWSPDGKRIATVSRDEVVRIWPADGSGTPTLLKHDGQPVFAVWSPDGKQIATGTHGSGARVWDAGDGTMKGTREGRSGRVTSAAWSPYGAHLLVATEDDEAYLFREAGGKPVVLTGAAQVPEAPFSSDGAHVLTVASDATTHVWSVQRGAKLYMLKESAGDVVSAAWSPDGKRIATASSGRVVRIWTVDPGLLISFLWRETSFCIPPEQRTELFGEDAETAQRGTTSCKARARREHDE